jgi:hypothetical protein
MSNALAGDITVITTADVNTARVIKIFLPVRRYAFSTFAPVSAEVARYG